MKKIMIVDDDAPFRTTLRAILEREGHQVSEAKSGQKCLDMLREGEKPDLILLDVMMPNMSGWEVSRRIKEDKKTKDIVVAMLTTKSHENDKFKSMGHALADFHISKPFETKEFLNTIKYLKTIKSLLK